MALTNIKYDCTVLFLREMHWLLKYFLTEATGRLQTEFTDLLENGRIDFRSRATGSSKFPGAKRSYA